MVIEQALFHIIDGQQMAFEKKFYELSDIFRNAEGCEKFKLIRGIENPQNYVLQIHWIDLAAHTDVFMKTEELVALGLDEDQINQLTCSVYLISKAANFSQTGLSTIQTTTEKIK